MIKTQTIKTKNPPKSLRWSGDQLIDWVRGGNIYHLDGQFEHSHIGIRYKFDSAMVSDNGVYVIVYEKLGTKAVILKNYKVLRELNRSYYHAHVYEYPIAIFQLEDGEYAIIHCPDEYCQLEIERIETGERLTRRKAGQSDDYFHSRLEVNSSTKYLISTGWYWHPWSSIEWYKLSDALKDASILDKTSSQKEVYPIDGEVSCARFISNQKIVIAMSTEDPLDDESKDNPHKLFSTQIGILNLDTLQLEKKATLQAEAGNLLPINEDLVWSLFEYPKIIDLNTGKIVAACKNMPSGKQTSSIIWHHEKLPIYAYDWKNRRLAIALKDSIEVLTYDE